MENRKFIKLRRWAREGIILVLLALAVMWGVDQYRKPTLPATFSATPMQGIDGTMHGHCGAQPGPAAADLRLGHLVQHLPLYHAFSQ